MNDGPPLRGFRTNMSAAISCGQCGRKEIVASGFNALTLSGTTLAECAVKAGWTVAPTFVCPDCSKKSRFFDMQVVDVRTGEIHLHRNFCRNMNDAFRLARLTYSNPAVFEVLPPKRKVNQ